MDLVYSHEHLLLCTFLLLKQFFLNIILESNSEVGKILEILVLEYDFGRTRTRTRTRGVDTRTRTRTRGVGTRTRTRTRRIGTRTCVRLSII
jgi:hypothetical protein